LDSKRLAAGQTTTVTQPAPAVVQPVVETAAPAPAPAPTVQEGDVVEFTELDSAPQPLSPMRAEYPRLAMQQKAKATVVVSALVSERGDVLEVKILKGDVRFGFNEAAVRAMRGAKLSVPMKDGKHVRTWRPQTFVFNPS
jgi:TonB family protein